MRLVPMFPLRRAAALLLALVSLPFPVVAEEASEAAPAPAPARPTKYAEASIEKIITGIHAERQRNEEFLRYNGISAFAAIGRVEFGDRKSLIVGSAPDADLRIVDTLAMPRHVRVTVLGDSFRIEALADSAIFRVGTREPRDTTVAPTQFSVARQGQIIGRFHVRLSHQNNPALILFDARAPRMSAFRGLKQYPVDLAWRYTAALVKAPATDTIALPSTRGTPRRALRAGWFDLMIGEKPQRLEAYRLLEPGAPEGVLAVFFKDATNGKETYRQGRYLDARPLGGSGRYLVDFNLAYNPACAYSEHYNCPLPTAANTLKISIPAGERYPANTASP